jgi:hypothetical protein
LALLGLFTVATVVMTWPAAWHLAGRLPDLGDPLVDIWVLSTTTHKILRLDFERFWEGNILWPSPFALTYNDHSLGWLPVTLPVYLVSGDMVVAYNVALLVSVVLAGYFMCLLARHLTGSLGAAVFAGLAFTFVPFRVLHWGHLNQEGYFWMPLALLALHRLIERPAVRWGAAAGGLVALQLLTGLYEGVFLGLLAALFVVFLAPGSGAWRRGRFWLAGAVGVTVLLAGTLWTVLPYLDAHEVLGFQRTRIEMARYSSMPRDYLTAPTGMRLLGWLGVPTRQAEVVAWPGAVVAAMALLGMIAASVGGLRRRDEKAAQEVQVPSVERKGVGHTAFDKRAVQAVSLVVLAGVLVALLVLLVGSWALVGRVGVRVDRMDQPYVLSGLILVGVAAVAFGPRALLGWLARRWFRAPAFYATAAALFWLLSLGPTIYLRPRAALAPGPYRLLAESVPGFSGMRTPCRMSIVVSLALTVLAAMGVGALLRRVRRRWMKGACAALVCGLVLTEFWAAPLPADPFAVAAHERDLCRWLARVEDDPIVIHYPLPVRDRLAWTQAYYMYLSALHGRRVVNPVRFHSVEPWVHRCVRPNLVQFPAAEAVDVLQALEVRYVAHHTDRPTTRPATQSAATAPSAGPAATTQDARLTMVRQFGPIEVYEVPPGRFNLPGLRNAPILERELIAFLRLLTVAKDESTMYRVEDGLSGAARRLRDRARCLALLDAGLTAADAPGREVLVRVLGEVGTPAAADRLVQALDDPEAKVREWALSRLATWRSPDAAANVLKALSRLTRAEERRPVLQNYADLSRRRAGESPPAAVQMLLDGMTAARDPAEKGVLLTMLGTVSDLAALEAAAQYLDDPALRDDAARAALRVARAIAAEHPMEVAAVAQEILAASPDPRIAAEARRLLLRPSPNVPSDRR